MAGFLSRLFGGAPVPSPHVEATINEVAIGKGWPDLEVSGEAHRRAEISRVFLAIGRPEGGVTMQRAYLVPEPTNAFDRNAVKVIIRGQHVGYVPADSSAVVAQACRAIGRNAVAFAAARVWARVDSGTWRARVTLAFSGGSEPEKDYAAERLQQEHLQAERDAEAERRATERRDREEAKRAKRNAGMVRGEYWTTWKPAIAELKKQQRLAEARDFLVECRDAAEREAQVAGDVPQPWASEQLAAVRRRMGDRDGELSELERYVTLCGDRAIPDSVTAKLLKARLARTVD